MEVVVKNLICIFTIVDSKINLLSNSNKLLEIDCNDDIELTNKRYIENNINIKGLNLKQCYTFSEKKDNKLTISILFSDIINYNEIGDNKYLKLIPISNIETKKIYLEKALEFLKKELVLNSTIKKLYPKEFSLPEIQKIYEQILDKKYDRRNFRKRLIKLDAIESLDKISSNKNGRPAKLYRFKEIKEDKILF